MGGREWGRDRVRPRGCDHWSLNHRGDPGGVLHGSRRRAGRGRDREPGEAIIPVKNFRSCTLVVLFSELDLEEPFTAAERTSEEARSGGPGGPLAGLVVAASVH